MDKPEAGSEGQPYRLVCGDGGEARPGHGPYRGSVIRSAPGRCNTLTVSTLKPRREWSVRAALKIARCAYAR